MCSDMIINFDLTTVQQNHFTLFFKRPFPALVENHVFP